MLSRSLSRAALRLLSVLAIVSTGLTAQVALPFDNGDFVACMRDNLGNPHFRVIKSTGSDYQLTGFSPAPAIPECVEIDTRNGDVIFVDAPGGSADLRVWRCDITSGGVGSQTLVGTLPGSGGLLPVYLHRSRTGSFVLLTADSYNPAAITQQKLQRFGLSRYGMVARPPKILEVSTGVNYTQQIESIAVNAIGFVRLAVPSDARFLFIAPEDGIVSGFGTQTAFISHAVEEDLGLSFQVEGGDAIAPSTTNFSCSAGVPISVSGSIVDIQLETQGTPTFALAMNGPTRIERVDATCLGTTTTFWTTALALTFEKITKFERSDIFGYSMPLSSMAVPTIVDLGNPTIGANWSIGLDFAGTTTATIWLGYSEQFNGGTPLPLALDPLGFVGCVQWSSWDAFANVSVTPTSSTFTIPVANNPALVGLPIYAQWVVYDAMVPGGAITTNSLGKVIQ